MTVVDQFEVYKTSALSGSFDDQIVFGYPTTNLVASQDPLDGSRAVIASSVQNKTSSFFREKFQLHSRILYASSSTFFGHPRRFWKISCESEFYYDSFAASGVEYYLADVLNGNSPVFVEGLQGSLAWAIPPSPDSSDGRGGPTSMTLVFASAWASSNSILNSFSVPHNVVWPLSYPFESKYKNFYSEKIFKPNYVLPNDYEITKTFGAGTISPASSSNTIGTIVWYGQFLRQFFDAEVHPTASLEDARTDRLIRPTLDEQQMLVFGFGEGDSTATNFTRENIKAPSEKFNSGTGFMIAPIIRGWKYGLLSGIPIRTNCVFRRSSFGQIRDMLEQRPYGKFLELQRGQTTTEAAVTVRFISGTLTYERAIDYLTSTNPSYNTTDSGIYSREYRSGQPFFDDR